MRRPLAQSALRAASSSVTPRCCMPSRLPPAAALYARSISTSRLLLAPAPPNAQQDLIGLVTRNLQDGRQESGSGEKRQVDPRGSSWPVRDIPRYPPPEPIMDKSGPMPFSSDPPNFSNTEWSLHRGKGSPQKPKEEEQPLRLGPSLGRTVHVVGRTDPARAFQLLGALCNRNSIARDFSRQKFHERPGLKKKRLRMQRWRKKFKIGFQAAARRVRELSRQGW